MGAGNSVQSAFLFIFLVHVVHNRQASFPVGPYFGTTALATPRIQACERLPELEKRKVAKFMAHLGSTQEKYYQALQADTDAVDASVCISGMMCERNEEEEADSMEVQQDCPMQEEVNDEDDEYIPPTCSGSLVGVQKPKRKRKLFSEADEQLLRKAVARKQKMGVTGTMSEAIHEIYDRHREQFGKYPFKSVYDKVRHGCMWL